MLYNGSAIEYYKEGFPKLTVDLSMVDINGNALTARETANCYVIKEPGKYMFPLVYGCGITDGEVNSAAYTRITGNTENTQPFYNANNKQITSPYIETDLGRSAVTVSVLYCDATGFTLSGFEFVTESGIKFLKFNVDAVPTLGGNAMIGIKDSNNEVMWSWHLWAYPFTLTTKRHNNGTNDYDFLDVNLGWVKNSLTDKYGTSPCYQWGRKDPMLRAANYSSDTDASYTGTWSIAVCATSLGQTIKNPNVFNTYGGNYNWWSNNGSAVNFYNYWHANCNYTGLDNYPVIKTVYDPCPVNFVIPCGLAYSGFTKKNGGTWDRGWTWDSRYFEAVGYRIGSNGGLDYVGSRGLYWSSAADSTGYAYYLSFNSGSVNPTFGSSRANCFSVVPVLVPRATI